MCKRESDREGGELRYIIWGTGAYCREKIKYWNAADKIVAFADRCKKEFMGRETILRDEIRQYTYDFIAVMSSHFLEIIPELVQSGIDCKKIIPGILCRPLTYYELDLMSHKSEIVVLENGTLQYIFDQNQMINISQESDWKKVRELMCSDKNAAVISRLDCRPAGRKFGRDRGTSICRYYIEKFLKDNQAHIRGDTLEIGDREYTKRYGTAVKRPYVLKYGDSDLGEYEFVGNLENGEGLRQDFYDCIIITQVLNFIFQVQAAADHVIRCLKPGGTALVTVSGIVPISRSDMDRYGHYWNFTSESLRRLFETERTRCEIYVYGNSKSACAFLQGMAKEELCPEELDDTDEDFQVLITAVAERIR